MRPISLPTCSLQHSWKSSSCPDLWTSCTLTASPSRTGGRGRRWGGGGLAALQTHCGCLLAFKGRPWLSHRCSGTPCRSWRTPCRGPGGRCWESVGSEPPTEAPAPTPGRLCHQVLLCKSISMGASAAQEWGVPCALSLEEHLPRSVRGW